uniref:Uncharacterized protein n=1 Tax=Anguilla anguilla TaxID=7936 RepID=A0A0E9XNH1_ANGAN
MAEDDEDDILFLPALSVEQKGGGSLTDFQVCLWSFAHTFPFALSNVFCDHTANPIALSAHHTR